MNAIDLITAAIDSLEQQRTTLAKQIEVLRRTLTELGDDARTEARASASAPLVPERPSFGRQARSVRDIALDVVRNASGEVSNPQVLEAAQAEGSNAKYSSVSSIMSRLVREGVLVQGSRRGTYRLAERSREQLSLDERESPPALAGGDSNPLTPSERSQEDDAGTHHRYGSSVVEDLSR